MKETTPVSVWGALDSHQVLILVEGMLERPLHVLGPGSSGVVYMEVSEKLGLEGWGGALRASPSTLVSRVSGRGCK